MTIQDPIADMFIRIQNAQKIVKPMVSMPSSRQKLAIAKLLRDEGYIAQYSEDTTVPQKPKLNIVLSYFDGKPVINKIKRVSTPGIRRYCGKQKLPRIMGGFGIAIVSTSKGLMTDHSARTLGIGGEVIGVVE